MPTFFDKNTNRFDKKNSLVPVWQRFGQGLVMPWEINQAQSDTSSQQQEASNANTLDTSPRQVQQPTWLQNPGTNEEQDRQEPQQDNQDRNDSGYSVAASLENNQDDTNWFGDSFGIKTAYADTGEESDNQNDDDRNSYVESSKIGSKIRNDLTKYAQDGVNPNDATKNVLLGKSPEDFSNPELQNPITEKLKTQITFPEKKDKSYLNDEDANDRYRQYVKDRGWRQTDEQIERAKDRYLNPFVLGNSQTDLLSEHGLSNQLDVVTADESTIDDIVSDSRFSLLDSPQELQYAYNERFANEKASRRKAREQERDQAIFKFFNRLFENDPEIEALQEQIRQENDEFLKDLNEQALKETSGIPFYDSNASGNTDVPTGVGIDDSFNLDAISTVAVEPTQVDNITQEQNDFVGPTQVDNITQEQNDFVGPTQVDNITQEQNDFVGPTQVDNITQEQNDFVGPTQVDNITQEQNDFVGPTQVHESPLDSWKSYWADQFQKAEELNKQNEARLEEVRKQQEEDAIKTFENIKQGISDLTSGQLLNDINNYFEESEKQRQEDLDNNHSVQILRSHGVNSVGDVWNIDPYTNMGTSLRISPETLKAIEDTEGFDSEQLPLELKNAYNSAKASESYVDFIQQNAPVNPYAEQPYIGISFKDSDPASLLEYKIAEYNTRKRESEVFDDILRDENGSPILDESGNTQLLKLNSSATTITKDAALELNRLGIIPDEIDDVPIRHYPDNTLFPKAKLGLDLDIEGMPRAAIDTVSSLINEVSNAGQHEYTISINGKDPIKEGDFNTTAASGWYSENVGNNIVIDKNGNRYSKDALPSVEDITSGNYSISIDQNAKQFLIERADGAVVSVPYSDSDIKQDEDGDMSISQYINDFLNSAYNAKSNDSFSVENLGGEYKPKNSDQTYTLEEVGQILDDSQLDEDDDTSFNKYGNIKYDFGPLNFWKPHNATAPANSIKGLTTDIIPNIKNIGLSSARFVFPKIAWPTAFADAVTYGSGKTPLFGGNFSRSSAQVGADTKNKLKQIYMDQGLNDVEATKKMLDHVYWWESKRNDELSFSQILQPLQEYGFTNNLWGANWLKFTPRLQEMLSTIYKKIAPEWWKKGANTVLRKTAASGLNEAIEEIPGDVAEEAGASGFGAGYYSPVLESGSGTLKDIAGNSLVEYRPGFFFWDDNGAFKQYALDEYLKNVPESAAGGGLFGTSLGLLTNNINKLNKNAYLNALKNQAKGKLGPQAHISFSK